MRKKPGPLFQVTERMIDTQVQLIKADQANQYMAQGGIANHLNIQYQPLVEAQLRKLATEILTNRANSL